MKKLIIITLLFTINQLTSQDSYKVEISSGYIVVDKFHHEIDWRNIYLSNFIQSQITIWKEFDFHRNFNASFGGGYTHFFVLDDGWILEQDYHLNYINVRFKVNHEFFSKKLLLSLGSSFYYFTKKTDQIERFKRQYFANIDLGLCYKINEKIQVSISSPFSLIPMYYGHVVHLDTSDEPFIFWGETTGVNLGLSYTFYQHRKK